MDGEQDITSLLRQAASGDPQRLAAVFEALYPELRRLARARLNDEEATLTPTALVNEVYLRLNAGEPLSLTDRKHFFAAAAKAMRWIVVDQARQKMADKRGGGQAAITLSERLAADTESAEVLALHDGLASLDQIHPRQREVVELRYFVGLEFSDVAELLACSESTVKRDWRRARAFLYAHMVET